jgi:predicted Fe-S protein YdhL (DUF1289 family)
MYCDKSMINNLHMKNPAQTGSGCIRISGVERYNWVSERITNKRKILRRSGEGEKGRYLP